MGGEVEIPASCKAACAHDIGPNFRITIEDVPVPKPGYGEILIRLNVTGICFSDIHYMLDDLGSISMTNYGVRSPGHEGVGEVVAIGEGVTEWSLGQRAGIKPVWSSCESCELCWTDREMYCAKSLQTGMHKPGTYQKYVLCSAPHAIKIPDAVEDAVAAPIMCSGATIYRGIKESGLKPGSWIVFSGAGGGVGHMGVQYAKAMGLRVVAIDGGDAKRDLCLKLGAEEFIDFTKVKDVAAKVVEVTKGGAHGVIVTASSAQAYASSIAMLRISGVLMCIGIPLGDSSLPGASPLMLLGKNIKLTGTIVGTRNDVVSALSYAERGLVKPEIRRYSFDQIEQAVRTLQKGDVAGRCVVSFD